MIPVYRKGNNSFIPKMAARAAGPGDEFTIVKNEKGKADIWKYFGLKKSARLTIILLTTLRCAALATLKLDLPVARQICRPTWDDTIQRWRLKPQHGLGLQLLRNLLQRDLQLLSLSLSLALSLIVLRCVMPRRKTCENICTHIWKLLGSTLTGNVCVTSLTCITVYRYKIPVQEGNTGKNTGTIIRTGTQL